MTSPDQEAMITRLQIVEDMLLAIDEWKTVDRAIANSKNREEAYASLLSLDLGFSTVGALRILDMPRGDLVEERVQALQSETETLRSAIQGR